mmetsp:Transcript_30484/g.87006  ORF Transcript_30484/g.87006 Transcript_30484/m.87006 type:complete len:201 (-) Transcript_30484:1461-2063(-)
MGEKAAVGERRPLMGEAAGAIEASCRTDSGGAGDPGVTAPGRRPTSDDVGDTVAGESTPEAWRMTTTGGAGDMAPEPKRTVLPVAVGDGTPGVPEPTGRGTAARGEPAAGVETSKKPEPPRCVTLPAVGVGVIVEPVAPVDTALGMPPFASSKWLKAATGKDTAGAACAARPLATEVEDFTATNDAGEAPTLEALGVLAL